MGWCRAIDEALPQLDEELLVRELVARRPCSRCREGEDEVYVRGKFSSAATQLAHAEDEQGVGRRCCPWGTGSSAHCLV